MKDHDEGRAIFKISVSCNLTFYSQSMSSVPVASGLINS